MGAQIRLWDPKQDYGSINEIMGSQTRLCEHNEILGAKMRLWEHK